MIVHFSSTTVGFVLRKISLVIEGILFDFKLTVDTTSIAVHAICDIYIHAYTCVCIIFSVLLLLIFYIYKIVRNRPAFKMHSSLFINKRQVTCEDRPRYELSMRGKYSNDSSVFVIELEISIYYVSSFLS